MLPRSVRNFLYLRPEHPGDSFGAGLLKFELCELWGVARASLGLLAGLVERALSERSNAPPLYPLLRHGNSWLTHCWDFRMALALCRCVAPSFCDPARSSAASQSLASSAAAALRAWSCNFSMLIMAPSCAMKGN